MLQAVVESASTVNFIHRNVLNHKTLGVRRGHRQLFQTHIVPVDVCFCEENMVFDFFSICSARTQTFIGIAIQ